MTGIEGKAEETELLTGSRKESRTEENKNGFNYLENPLVYGQQQPGFARNLIKKRPDSDGDADEGTKDEKALFLAKGHGSSRTSSETEAETAKSEDLSNLLCEPEDRNVVASSFSNDRKSALFVSSLEEYNLVYIIFYILGFGTLLPWNFFITANQYFQKKLSPTPALVTSFQNFFSVAAMVPSTTMMILNIFVLSRYNRKIRIAGAIIAMFFIFALTTALVIINSNEWTGTFFAVTISSMVLINTSSGILQGALFGLAGMFPPRYTQAVMGGQGFAGLFASLASIFAMLGNDDIYKSAFGYFFTATAVLLICLFGFLFLQRLEYARHYTESTTYKCTCKCDETGPHTHLSEFINEDAVARKESLINFKATKEPTPYIYIFKKIGPMAFGAFMVFFVCLSVFPSVTARIVPMKKDESAWTKKFFTPVTCFLLFNMGDYAGRTMAGFFQKPGRKGPWLPIVCFARTIFFPLFILCNAQPRPNDTMVLFQHDAFPIIIMILFSLSNGYFGSLAMMYGPSMVPSQHAEVAGTTMACCLGIGLASGAAFSFAMTAIL